MPLKIPKLVFCCLITVLVISSISSEAGIPPKKLRPPLPASAIRFIVAYLTLKNSSRLFEKIPIKRNLSSSGVVVSSASCNTRALNCNQLNSRL